MIFSWLRQVVAAIPAEAVNRKDLSSTLRTQMCELCPTFPAELLIVRIVGLALWTFHLQSINPLRGLFSERCEHPFSVPYARKPSQHVVCQVSRQSNCLPLSKLLQPRLTKIDN